MGLRGAKPKRKEIVWSSNLAYAIGLLASDGNLSHDGRHLSFVSKDLEQVQNLKKCLEINVQERQLSFGGEDNQHVYYRVQWGDVTLHTYLVSIGITPNKSLAIGKVDIPDTYFFDFLRGSFDGDGCFYSYFDPRWKNSFMFYLAFTSASLEHVTWIQNSIKKLSGVQGHISSRHKNSKDNGFHQVRYAKRESRIVLELMYKNFAAMCLTRKRLKIESALGIVGLSLHNIVQKI